MLRRKVIMIACLMLPLMLMAQAKKPTLMVVPADVWCVSNGFVVSAADDSGAKLPDYNKALSSSTDCYNVITKINLLMSDRGFPLKDLSTTLKTLALDDMADMATRNSNGAELAESFIDCLKRNANADIVLEVNWSVNHMGPKRSITYSLAAKDSYTNKQVAGAQATGVPSFSAELPVLLEEAVLANMDNFCAQLQAHFDDMMANGREVVMDVKVVDDGSGLNLESEYGGDELTDIIDTWVADNTVAHRYNLSSGSDNFMKFEQVRIPLYLPNGRANDTRRWTRQLSKFLLEKYGIQSKVSLRGLGRAVLLLGEK